MQLKKYVKAIKLLLLISVITFVNLKCCRGSVPFLDRYVKIENDIVESSNQLAGKIGYCGISHASVKEGEPYLSLVPDREYFLGSIYYLYLEKLQNLFLDSIGNRELVDCNFETLKDFDYRKSKPKYSSFPIIVHGHSFPKGYIMIYDEKYDYYKWMMNKDSLRFLNEFYNCDYYLTGKIFMSYEKESGWEHNLLLVIYDNKGYKVWSKRYRGKYSFDNMPKHAALDGRYYENIQQLFKDFKVEINQDLDLIIGKAKD